MPRSKVVGTREEVYHGTATHTSGGLYKKDLFRDDTRSGQIRSIAASEAARRNNNLGSFLSGGRRH